MALFWTIERAQALASLQALVREAGSVNGGNRIIERLQRLEKLGEDKPTGELLHALKEAAWGERTAALEAGKLTIVKNAVGDVVGETYKETP